MEYKNEYKKNTREGKQFVLGEKKNYSRDSSSEKMKRKKKKEEQG